MTFACGGSSLPRQARHDVPGPMGSRWPAAQGGVPDRRPGRLLFPFRAIGRGTDGRAVRRRVGPAGVDEPARPIDELVRLRLRVRRPEVAASRGDHAPDPRRGADPGDRAYVDRHPRNAGREGATGRAVRLGLQHPSAFGRAGARGRRRAAIRL